MTVVDLIDRSGPLMNSVREQERISSLLLCIWRENQKFKFLDQDRS